MDEMRELYQATILDHNRKPRNFRSLEAATASADGHNPLCGDKLTVYLLTDDDNRVIDASFQGSGCAISTASASLLTEYVKGKPIDEINRTFEQFHTMVTTSATVEPDIDGLGKLAVFAGVREFPMRVKCATLSWHTLKAALANSAETAKTE